jgi:hypothetical protein
MKITIKIGAASRTYLLCHTNAPSNYDYDGVIELYSSNPYRVILVPEKSLEYQKGRNASGLKTLDVYKDEPTNRSWAENKLWERIK